MIVRGWLILGSLRASHTLPPDRNRGRFLQLPEASAFAAGEWIVWDDSRNMVTLVCVELPL
jgi:hypothetical protein